MKLLFTPSWHSATRASALTGQPLFVYLDETDALAEKHIYSNTSYDLPAALRRNFVCVKPGPDARIEELAGLQMASFTVIRDAVKDSFVDGDFEAFLQKYVPELPVKQKTPKPQRHMSEKEEDLARIRAQIAADKKERISQRSKNARSATPKPAKTPISDSQCKLLIRLLDGETILGTFSTSQTLCDVKRWIEKEKGLVFSPERDNALPSFAHTSASALNHYAFCYLGVPRVTFSAGQELTRLGDLGLSPRLALVLKPVHSEKAKQLPGLWSSICGKAKFVTGALYTFFDYGLEDAERDWTAVVDDAQPAFVVPEHPETDEDTKKGNLLAGTSGMAPVSGTGNQLHVLHDREAEQRQ